MQVVAEAALNHQEELLVALTVKAVAVKAVMVLQVKQVDYHLVVEAVLQVLLQQQEALVLLV